MQAPRKQLAGFLLAGLALTSFGLSGCDSESGKADKEVAAGLAAAQNSASAGRDSIADLEKAAANTGASPTTRVNAKSILAQAELNAANAVIRANADANGPANLEHKQVQIAGLISDMHQIALQIQAGNVMTSGYAKREPTAERAALKAKIDEAKGGAGKDTWFSQDKEPSSIPTLEAAKAKVASLQGDISKNEDQLKSLTDQRGQLLDQGEKLTVQSEGVKGQDSVKLYKDGSEARKKAADTGVQIDNIAAMLDQQKADLAIATGQQKAVEQAIAGFEAQLKQVEDAWAEVQKQSDAQQSTAQKLVSGSEGSTLAAKAAEVAKLTAEVKSLRETAVANLDNAVKHFDDAEKAAEQVKSEAQSHNESRDVTPKPAWKMLQEVVNPASYKFQEGNAQMQLATVYAGQAEIIAARLKLLETLKPILSAARQTIPAELDDASLANDLKPTRDLADGAYNSANDTFTSIAEMPSANEDLRGGSQVARMTTLYAWSQLAAASGDADKAGKRFEDAKQARDQAIQANIPLPVLPEDLQPAPVAPAHGLPESSPTTAPATAPAAT